MDTLCCTIQPCSAFGTPLVGDTLFGQLCWALRHRFGKGWLVERLQGYTEGRPFVVISDAFPQGFFPLPAVPSRFFHESSEDRKTLKKKRWLAVAEMDTDFREWQRRAKSDHEAADIILGDSGFSSDNAALQKITAQPHNSINRATGTTGEGMFAPYSMSQIWFHPAMRFDLHMLFDTERISKEELTAALTDIGQSGYGRDASIGLGKFNLVGEVKRVSLANINKANAWLTLAPCAPQGLGFDGGKSYYRPFTRFGRHGSTLALAGSPFKRPVLLAATGGVFTPAGETSQVRRLFIGQGLGGVSPSQPETVSQGYAPVQGIFLEDSQ
ncbi:type III-A CRISPR-associated RAMP protein Csm4 [Desulfobulbus alkaliphilus]|uniref:type III-A CRISPR-associated RAMP protein Csm4 n=1 Tax=Desulfobulbus alkaliphilus TaxID=869814 RepID=UPI001962BEB6|nr:RAMP superfamily CRISPR-associated protein [Desulfobulbus alkaliphilus]MBM9536301.1 hypothetical protein [Desulfobulbus alkaliphilus]